MTPRMSARQRKVNYVILTISKLVQMDKIYYFSWSALSIQIPEICITSNHDFWYAISNRLDRNKDFFVLILFIQNYPSKVPTKMQLMRHYNVNFYVIGKSFLQYKCDRMQEKELFLSIYPI